MTAGRQTAALVGLGLAAEIAISHSAELVSWRHDPDFADSTPHGATFVVLAPRL